VLEGTGGKAIQAATQAGRLEVVWDASDCPALDADGQETEQTRLYLGSDGVMVPLITQAEKEQRRAKVKAKRRRRGKKCKPLPRAKNGTNGPFKEFKIVTLYDDQAEHRLVSVTRGDCQVAERIMRRDSARVGLPHPRRFAAAVPPGQVQGKIPLAGSIFLYRGGGAGYPVPGLDRLSREGDDEAACNGAAGVRGAVGCRVWGG
jgi:hypothetical protein